MRARYDLPVARGRESAVIAAMVGACLSVAGCRSETPSPPDGGSLDATLRDAADETGDAAIVDGALDDAGDAGPCAGGGEWRRERMDVGLAYVRRPGALWLRRNERGGPDEHRFLRYDGASWTTTPAVPLQSLRGACAFDDHQLIVAGTNLGPVDGSFSFEVWRFDGTTWSRITQVPYDSAVTPDEWGITLRGCTSPEQLVFLHDTDWFELVVFESGVWSRRDVGVQINSPTLSTVVADWGLVYSNLGGIQVIDPSTFGVETYALTGVNRDGSPFSSVRSPTLTPMDVDDVLLAPGELDLGFGLEASRPQAVRFTGTAFDPISLRDPPTEASGIFSTRGRAYWWSATAEEARGNTFSVYYTSPGLGSRFHALPTLTFGPEESVAPQLAGGIGAHAVIQTLEDRSAWVYHGELPTVCGSCGGRCGDADDTASCQCDFACVARGDCCHDYETMCAVCATDDHCADGDPCTRDQCSDGACRHERDGVFCTPCAADSACDDFDACTTDACSTSRCEEPGRAYADAAGGACACEHTRVEGCELACHEGDDRRCVDGDPCTLDRCEGGACVHEPIPECVACRADDDCDDSDACTRDECSAFEPPTPFSARVDGRCQNREVGGCCRDVSECSTSDPCVMPACTDNQCDLPHAPGCELCATDGHCYDGNACTTDRCVSGSCEHTPRSGCVSCRGAADCDDGDGCTRDVCSYGACGHTRTCSGGGCTGDAECADGDACTLDSCVGGVCQHAPRGCAAGSGCCPTGGGGGACTSRNDCIRIRDVRRGTSCGRPESMSLTYQNICSYPVYVRVCADDPDGTCDCEAGELRAGQSYRTYFCSSTGRYRWSAVDSGSPTSCVYSGPCCNSATGNRWSTCP